MVWNKWRVSKWWQNFHFWVKRPINTLHVSAYAYKEFGVTSCKPQTEQKHFKIAAFPPDSFSCFMVMFSNYSVFCVKSVREKKHLQAAFFL